MALFQEDRCPLTKPRRQLPPLTRPCGRAWFRVHHIFTVQKTPWCFRWFRIFHSNPSKVFPKPRQFLRPEFSRPLTFCVPRTEPLESVSEVDRLTEAKMKRRNDKLSPDGAQPSPERKTRLFFSTGPAALVYLTMSRQRQYIPSKDPCKQGSQMCVRIVSWFMSLL